MSLQSSVLLLLLPGKYRYGEENYHSISEWLIISKLESLFTDKLAVLASVKVTHTGVVTL